MKTTKTLLAGSVLLGFLVALGFATPAAAGDMKSGDMKAEKANETKSDSNWKKALGLPAPYVSRSQREKAKEKADDMNKVEPAAGSDKK